MVHNHVCNSLELQVGFLHIRKDISMTSFAIRYRAAMAPPTEMQLRRNLVGSTDPRWEKKSHRISSWHHRPSLGIVDYAKSYEIFMIFWKAISHIFCLMANSQERRFQTEFEFPDHAAVGRSKRDCTLPAAARGDTVEDKTRRSKLVQSRWHMFNWTG